MLYNGYEVIPALDACMRMGVNTGDARLTTTRFGITPFRIGKRWYVREADVQHMLRGSTVKAAPPSAAIETPVAPKQLSLDVSNESDTVLLSRLGRASAFMVSVTEELLRRQAASKLKGP